MRATARLCVTLALASGCATYPLVFPRTEVSGIDQDKAVAVLAAAGYTIKVATDSVVVTEALGYGAILSTGARIPTREVAQIALAGGVASIRMKVDCDLHNQYMYDPTPTRPVTWAPCKHSKTFPMNEAKERFLQIAEALGVSPLPDLSPPSPGRKQ